MALKVLLLRSRLLPLQAQLDQLRTTASGFAAREAELARDIEAAQTDEERAACETAVTAFEQERDANTADITRVEGEVRGIEEEIRSAETAQTPPPAPAAPADHERSNHNMPFVNPERRWFGLTYEQRDQLLARDDIKAFTAQLRSLRGQTRAVTGAELGVPTMLLGVLQDNVERYSKLISRVTVRPIKGKGRQNVAGSIPEGIWTEATASLSELSLSFTQLEFDGYKVGGFIAIPNSYLEDDDDLQLMTYILDAMGQAIGYALDKAIVYGDGVKKPVGFVPRLAAAVQPAWWGSNQGAFTNLSASNVLKLDLGAKNGVDFFQPLLGALGITSPKYSDGRLTWIMNRKTHIDLLTRCLAFDMNAALLAGMQNTMPVIGGDIIELDFMADNDIAGGYLGLQLMIQRSGANIQSSDIPKFLDDQTVTKGTQRWDGKPVRGEGFVIVNYNNVAPTVSATFPAAA